MKFWNFKNKDEKTGELMLYGDISSSSWWGDEVTPKNFKSELDALGDISTLNIYINSGGGDVFAGQAIYNMLKRHKAEKNVYVDGLAASIASVIAMAGDTVYMPSNAMMMVHRAWTIAMGNANDFRKMADDMEQIDQSIIEVYKAKTGMSDAQIIELLDAETWLTAKDAIGYGFANEIQTEKQVAASVDGKILNINDVQVNIERFKNPPRLAFLPPKNEEQPKEVEQLPPPDNGDDIENKPKPDASAMAKQKFYELTGGM